MTDTPKTTRPRHIAIVSETFPPEINGVANTLRHLCQGLMKQGHRVSVVRPRQRHEQAGAVASAGQALFTSEQVVTGLPLPGYPDLRFGVTRSRRLVNLWREQRPDAIYVATQGPLGVTAVNAARQLSIPVSSGFHTNFHTYSRYYGAGFLEKLLCSYGRWFHNRTSVTLVPTRKMQLMVQAMGVNPTGLWSRGVDCHRFAPHKRDMALRKHWGVGEHDRVVLYVGRLASEKNLQMATACFERIRNLHPRSKFVLVGDGPLRRRLAERHPDYLFCGMQRGEDLARHYASGDIFLFPSKTDTFGNVVTEAMASGLAVVAYDDAAASEHIRHEGNGMKADLNDDDGFIDAALKLVDQPTLLSRLRAQARLDALDLNWSSQIEQFEQLVLNQQHRAKYHAIKQSIPLL
ncbi:MULTISPECIES: glycosyltransferase family 4 protein [Marinobacter]|uniref:glycosyltransferase family 4 protein n=1 Tax=Marinobacter TaxID=2742 RepID=UPI001D0843DD|nr:MULTISPECIES: glycosyltransferase family 1 protein [Marinobacter]MCG8518287.1 glycosyltransferase family 1 protein [Pseudomonadales bacterium]MCK7567716.1 glycosyltransferase family 1 protein [Marinobacter xestospongiae]UDL04203.1 glycosyltransferase family 1 protein [Marinobacter sp. CA1]